MIDTDKIQQGSEIIIWSSRYNCEKKIKITYRRLNVVFFMYDSDIIEDWLPTGSYIIAKSEFA